VCLLYQAWGAWAKTTCREWKRGDGIKMFEKYWSTTSNEKGGYAMRKRKRLSYHKLRNTKTFSVFPTMLDTQTIIIFCVLFHKQIQVSACQSFVSVIVRSQYSSATNDLNVAVTLMTWVHSLSVSVSKMTFLHCSLSTLNKDTYAE